MGVWSDCTWNSICDGGLVMIQLLRGKRYLMRVQATPEEIEQMFSSYQKKYPFQSPDSSNFHRWLVSSGKVYKEIKHNPGRKLLSGHVSTKAQRAYEDILASERRYGRYKGREKEVAARTVRGMIRSGVLNPHFRGRYVSVPRLSASMLYTKNKKQLLALKRKQESYADELDRSMDGWDKVTEPQYQSQKISAMRVLRKDRDMVEDNIRGINAFLQNANPGEAAEISEGFHGRPPSETIDVEEEEQYAEELGVLGCLVELHITRDNGETSVKLRFPIPTDPKFEDGDEVYLAAPNKHQMEFVGGDQEIANIDEIAKHTDKQLVKLGCLDKIVYLTDKYHLDDSDGKEAEYVHELGKKKMFGFSKKRTGRPEVIYDTVNQQLKLVGGTYSITDEGIIN